VTWVQLVGWAGNAAFFSRFLVQWLASERAKRTVAPSSFWWISLFGSAALSVYTLERGEPVLLAGYLVNAAIYVRNLLLRRSAARGRGPSLPVLVLCALGATAVLVGTGAAKTREGLADSPFWLGASVVGTSIWSSRFVVQWWMSERRRESHFPVVFWWLSLAGNVLLFAYALHLRDPVYIAGYCIGPIVQVRNLMLSRGPGRGQAELSG
jgi:lipid-A-disaccharide synthase-like uncharacterized protein